MEGVVQVFPSLPGAGSTKNSCQRKRPLARLLSPSTYAIGALFLCVFLRAGKILPCPPFSLHKTSLPSRSQRGRLQIEAGVGEWRGAAFHSLACKGKGEASRLLATHTRRCSPSPGARGRGILQELPGMTRLPTHPPTHPLPAGDQSGSSASFRLPLCSRIGGFQSSFPCWAGLSCRPLSHS